MTRLTQRNIEVIDEATADMYRRMSGARRRQVASKMYTAARGRIAARLRREHPEWSPRQIHRETVRRLSHGEVLLSD